MRSSSGRTTSWSWKLLAVSAAALGLGVSPGHDDASMMPALSAGAPLQAVPRSRFGRLPLRFEENIGQSNARVRFVGRHAAATVFATDAGLTLAMRSGPVLEMSVPGARSTVVPSGRDELLTRTHHLQGREPAGWSTDIRNYGAVVYESVLDGIDLVVHGEDGQLEYDFVVAPGADPSAAIIEIGGADELSLTAEGDLAIHTEQGDIVQRRPRVFQRGAGGATIDVAAQYRIVDRHRVGFTVAATYDPSRELVIDPVIAYSTYLGGAAFDDVRSIAVDSTGASYIAGYTQSSDFPTNAGAFAAAAPGGATDAFIAKLTPAGDALVYATYIGGSGSEALYGAAVGADGGVYAAGYTTSTNFPVVGPIQSTYAGGWDAFVLKLDALGSGLTYSTYLGGTDGDLAYAIAVDGGGNAYVAGMTMSADFPVKGPIHTFAGVHDGFVAKLSPSGSELVYSTYVGGNDSDTIRAIAVDASGSAYVTGHTQSTSFASASNTYGGGGGDAFVTKLNAAGSAVVYSRYLGGSGTDDGTGIAVDASGSAYVTGTTSSPTFPTAPATGALQPTLAGNTDAFVAKLAPAGSSLVYSTYLGGSDDDAAMSIAVDGNGTAHVVGSTSSMNFPVRNALQAELIDGTDVFLARLGASGTSIVSATYLGGTAGSKNEDAYAIAVDTRGDAYVGGSTSGRDFPLVKPIQDANPSGAGSNARSGFVTKIATPPLAIAPKNAAVPPGSNVTFVGSAGSGPGYRFILKANASGGTIDPSSGVYTAGSKTGTTDEVLVIDEAGDEAAAVVAVTEEASTPPVDSGTPPPAADAGPEPGPAAADTGCGCRAVGGRHDAPWIFAGALAALVWAFSRRGTRRTHE